MLSGPCYSPLGLFPIFQGCLTVESKTMGVIGKMIIYLLRLINQFSRISSHSTSLFLRTSVSHLLHLKTSYLTLSLKYIKALKMVKMGYSGYYPYRKLQPPHFPAPINPVSWRFLDFPAEIRNLIYHYLLVDNSYDPECLVEQRFTRKRLFPAIMRTCRKIHDEAVYVLYGGNYFTIEINDSKDCYVQYKDRFWSLYCLLHAPLMRNWQILIKKYEYPRSGLIHYKETISWKLRTMCMNFQKLKIRVSNLLIYIEDSLPLIKFPRLDLLSPLKELCVSGKVSIYVKSQHNTPYESSIFEYFQNVKAAMKQPAKIDGLNAITQEDARAIQSRFFIQDLETVAKIFQRNIDDEKCLMELQDILRMLERDRTKGISQSAKRMIREELCQYLGRLEDIFNCILYRRMKTRLSFDFNAGDRDLRAMSKARRWLYMRPEYLAWIERHDRNARNSRGPVYYQDGFWDSDPSWHKKERVDPEPLRYCSCTWCFRRRPDQVQIDSQKPQPSPPPRQITKIYRPHNPNEQYAITLQDLYAAEDMTPGLRDQASNSCTLKFRVSHRQQHRRGISSKKTQREKKPGKKKWVADCGEKLGNCLEFYEECF